MIGKVANDETEAQDDDVYLHNVKTYEALTESAFQITILFLLLLLQGMDDVIVLVSASISFLTLIKSNASRLATVRSNTEVGILSWNFGKGCLRSMQKHFLKYIKIIISGCSFR